jgi:hypothetical protein
MRKTEKILIVMVVLGQIMRLMDIQGGVMISILAAFLLSILYVFFGFLLFTGQKINNLFQKRKSLQLKGIVISITTGLALMLCISGILLKVHIIQDAHIPIVIALIMMSIVLFLLWKTMKNTVLFSKVKTRIIGFGIAGLLLIATPYDWLVDAFYFRDPEYRKEIKERMRGRNEYGFE